MIVRQTTTTILSLQLILLLLSRHVAAISLSQFQQIQGFSDSCENVWQEDIPGCTKKDFTTSNNCSRNCLAGVNIINAEVLVACAEARVSSNTLLGEFLAGFGVSALCGSSDTTETATMADSTTATATAMKTTTTSTGKTSVQSTTTTAVQETTTQPSDVSTTASATTSTPSSVTTSPAATSITDPNITLSFAGPTASPTSSVSSTTTSAKTTSTSSSDTEAKGFGGVGDAFDILGGESAGSRSEYVSWQVMSLMSVLVITIARGYGSCNYVCS